MKSFVNGPRYLMVFAALVCTSALAGNHPKPAPNPDPIGTVTAVSTSDARADASSRSSSDATSVSNATGGKASSTSNATGGTASAQGGDSDADASSNSGGNTFSNATTYKQVRQAPSVGLGALMIGECGAGANGGGSNSRGSALLGFAWTPKDCKYLLAARAFASLGMFTQACEMVSRVSVVHQFYGDNLSCEFEEKLAGDPAIPAAAPVDLSKYATKDELNRAFRTAVGK